MHGGNRNRRRRVARGATSGTRKIREVGVEAIIGSAGRTTIVDRAGVPSHRRWGQQGQHNAHIWQRRKITMPVVAVKTTGSIANVDILLRDPASVKLDVIEQSKRGEPPYLNQKLKIAGMAAFFGQKILACCQPQTEHSHDSDSGTTRASKIKLPSPEQPQASRHHHRPPGSRQEVSLDFGEARPRDSQGTLRGLRLLHALTPDTVTRSHLAVHLKERISSASIWEYRKAATL